MRLFGAFVGVAALTCACACAPTAPPAPLPRVGERATEVVFENHLPATFRVASLVAVLDGEVVYNGSDQAAPRVSIFRADLPEGDHTLVLRVRLDVSCGHFTQPHETLTIRDTRSFTASPTGGLVHIDTFTDRPWLDLDRRVRMRVTLHGMTEGRWIYAHTDDAKRRCGGLERVATARCIVQQLVDMSRKQRDVVAVLCHKEKLDAIDAALALLAERDPSEPSDASERAAAEARILQLQREAEYCVGEELAFVGNQEITWDRGGCIGDDDRSAGRR
jgi:hypothetical protein